MKWGYVNNIVASFGCRLSEEQQKLLFEKKIKKVIIAYDADKSGKKGTRRAIKSLLREVNTFGYIRLPKGKDVAECSRKEFERALDRAVIVKNSNLKMKMVNFKKKMKNLFK